MHQSFHINRISDRFFEAIEIMWSNSEFRIELTIRNQLRKTCEEILTRPPLTSKAYNTYFTFSVCFTCASVIRLLYALK